MEMKRRKWKDRKRKEERVIQGVRGEERRHETKNEKK